MIQRRRATDVGDLSERSGWAVLRAERTCTRVYRDQYARSEQAGTTTGHDEAFRNDDVRRVARLPPLIFRVPDDKYVMPVSPDSSACVSLPDASRKPA